MAAALTLYLVRHGETEYNRRRLMQGRRINAPLNRVGLAQAGALAGRFCGTPLDAIYVSPMRRAMETAQPVRECHPAIPMRVDDELAEMSWGELEGRSVDDVGDVLVDFARRWKQGSFEGRVGGGESILDVAARARRVLDRIVERHAGDVVLVVTHGRFLRVMLATALPEVGLRHMDQFGHDNTGVYRLRIDDDGTELELRNCTRHLDRMGDAA